ncbi:Nucleotide-diphospho-sugar transferase [Dillenia turbinata]|uniref:Nucleotide-diphospho-sugar transferase n=1 Tax=Dillenia turbinata TaxID=194707 RepID=A0AAN8ZH35_9MAGN
MGWWRNSFQDVGTTKPVFITIYITLLVGIIFSAFYVFSAIYSPISTSTSSSLFSFSSSYLSNSSQASNRSHSHTSIVPAITPPTPAAHRSKQVRPIWEVPPPGTKMPPTRAFRLTKELVQQRAIDNIIIVTFGNYAFMDFILTWVKHLTDLGLFNLLVGAMDTKLLEDLYWRGIPIFDMGSHMSTADVGWGSPSFHKMGREKVFLINAICLLAFSYQCDTDMVWLKNPLPYFARFRGADVLTSSDQVIPTVVDDGLDIWQKVGAAYNIGIFHWRPTDSSKKMAKEWKDLLLADEKIWDQNGFNDLMRRQLGPSVNEESGLVYAFDGNLKLGILPASIFCSGHTYFVQAQKENVIDYGKQSFSLILPNIMILQGVFLSFKTLIPKSLLLEGEHTIDSHFSLVNHQIKQIRTALAVASLLNRTLVIPPIWCRLDRLWFPHPGILVGSMTRQPFLCPLDHVFEVNVMLKELPEEDYGPGIGIREYSFFENPSLPKQVRESWLDVQLCEGSQDCHVSNNTTPQRMLRFPKRSSEEMFKTAFSAFKDVKKREEKFRRRVKRYGGIWCCVENHSPGHIYYDMYWDEKPEWKPVPPRTPQDDHPPW